MRKRILNILIAALMVTSATVQPVSATTSLSEAAMQELEAMENLQETDTTDSVQESDVTENAQEPDVLPQEETSETEQEDPIVITEMTEETDNTQEESSEATVETEVEKSSEPEILALNQTYPIQIVDGDGVSVSFTPEVAGLYKVTCSNYESAPEVSIYCEDYHLAYETADDEDDNFSFSYVLNEGVEYRYLFTGQENTQYDIQLTLEKEYLMDELANEGPEKLFLDKEEPVRIVNKYKITGTFTPEVSGPYTLNVRFHEDLPQINFYDADGADIPVKIDDYSTIIYYSMILTAGKEYTYCLSSASNEVNEYSMKMIFEGDEENSSEEEYTSSGPDILKLNETQHIKVSKWMSHDATFTPSVTGVYMIIGSNYDGGFPGVYLYHNDTEIDYSYRKNFLLTAVLRAGVEYRYRFEMNGRGKDLKAVCDVKLTLEKKLSEEEGKSFGPEVLETDKEEKVHLVNNETIKGSFTPAVTGVYALKILDYPEEEPRLYSNIYNEKGEEIGKSEIHYKDYIGICWALKAGEKYTYSFSINRGNVVSDYKICMVMRTEITQNTEPFTMKLKTKYSIKKIKESEEDAVAVTFIPEKTGTYRILSSENSDVPTVRLYEGENYISDDYGTSENSNFALESKLEAGVKYTYILSATGGHLDYNVQIVSGHNYIDNYCTHCGAIEKLSTPKLSSVTNTSSGVSIKWGAVSKAKKYRVYRKTGSGSYQKLGDTTSTSYTDKTGKAGTLYQYTVCCITTTGKTISSNAASKKMVRLSTPSISSLSNTKGYKLTAKWKKQSTATGYEVMYATNKTFTSGKKTIKITKNSTVSYKSGKLSKNKTYYVKIRTYKTVSGVKYYSGWSGVKSVKIKK